MKSAGSRQLALAFADSPTGSRDRGTQDESRGKRYLLHTAKVNNRKDPATSTAAADSERAMESVASAHNLAQALLNVSRNKGAPGVDDQTVEEVVEQAPSLLPKLQTALLQGTYQPGDIRRVWIEKPGGGQRGLGIPNVMDRWVQQAALQILEPIFEPTFHASSHGFRPNRGAHTAIAEAKEHLKAGYRVLVDLDLSKFFDRVHHQRLLERLRQQVCDSRILDLVKRMLTAKVVMPDGTKVATIQGTPQGGPLSPLLSNIVLDEWDRELGRRGLRFVRYADDCNIFVRSRRAGRRVMESTRRFLETKLRLQINEEKSSVTTPGKVHFLGFRFKLQSNNRVAVLLSATMHTCSAGCGPSSFAKRNGRAFCTVISCDGELTLDKLPAPPTVGGASGIAVTARGSMWRTRIRGSLPSGLHPMTSGALRTLQQKSLTSLVWRFESTIQRAGCEARKSGSVRGAAGQPAVPTRQRQPKRAPIRGRLRGRILRW